MTTPVYRFGEFELRPADFALLRDGRRVKLSPKAFDVLRLLVERHGRLVEKEELLRTVWPDTFVEDANLSVQVAAIRRVLGRAPTGEYIETVPKRGYKFMAIEAPPAAAGGDQRPSAPTATPRSRSPVRIVVLPLAVLRSDLDTDFLAFSLPDAIATMLAESPRLQIRSPLASPGAAAGADLAALAATTGGTHALTGTLLRVGEEIRVGIQLLDLPDATLRWTATLTSGLDGLFELERDVARRVVRALTSSGIVEPGPEPPAAVPQSGAAHALYLRANQLAYEASQWGHARALYRECVQGDPAYAPAWAGLARCERVLGKFSASEDEARARRAEAERAFERALALDPDLSLAHNLYAQLEVDLGRAVDAMRRLIALARRRPVDPQPYAGLVHALRFCGLLDASVAAHHRARELDPSVPTSVHQTWWMLGEYERALGATFGDVGYMPGVALAALGREQEAVTVLRWRERETRDTTVRLLLVSLRAALEGARDESLAAIDRVARSPLDGEARFYLARTCARLGEPGRALDLLEGAVAAGFVCHQTFRGDPWLAPIRGAARFDALVTRACERAADARRAFDASGGIS